MSRISEVLQAARTIAVVGLSGKRFRPSYGVAEYMKRSGYHIIPVNPNEAEVLGERCYPDLDAVSEAIDIVDIFRQTRIACKRHLSKIRHTARSVRRPKRQQFSGRK